MDFDQFNVQIFLLFYIQFEVLTQVGKLFILYTWNSINELFLF